MTQPPPADYTDRQRLHNAEYLRAWEAMSPEQRAQLAAAGVPGPDCADEPAKDLCREDDAAALFDNDITHATHLDIAAAVDRLPDYLAEQFHLTPDQAHRIAAWHSEQVQSQVQRETSLQLNRIIGFFLLPGNVLVRAHALAHAARMAALSGLRSLRHSAELCDCSVEGIRKVAWKWIELLSLPPLEGSKSPEARQRYSADKKTNHWRHQKCTTDNLPPSSSSSTHSSSTR